MPNKLHAGKSGASTFSRLCDACTWRVSCSAIRSTRLQVHHPHQAQLVVGNKGSCHLPTPAALHCCLQRLAHQLCRVFAPAKTTSLVTCCPAGFIDRERTGSTHVLLCLCCSVSVPLLYRLACLPARLSSHSYSSTDFVSPSILPNH
jgi:hypothetical protein